MTSYDTEFRTAAKSGNVEEMKKIIAENPNIDVNGWCEDHYFTALHSACLEDHGKVVALLLDHPDVRVNEEDEYGWTPFLTACAYESLSCIRLLLRDPRVSVNQPDATVRTPLWHSVRNGNLDAMKLCIASGKELTLGRVGEKRVEVFRIVEEKTKKRVTSLLKKFQDNPRKTRDMIRMRLGGYDELAADFFSLVVFLCDGLLDLQKQTSSGAVRFFQIASRLPVEIQMILCLRVARSCGENIPVGIREASFKELSRDLLS